MRTRGAGAGSLRATQAGRDAARDAYCAGAAGAARLEESVTDNLDDSPVTLAAAIALGAMLGALIAEIINLLRRLV